MGGRGGAFSRLHYLHTFDRGDRQMKCKLTQDLIARAAELYRRGCKQQDIYTALGIPERTWFSWLERGRDGKQPYVALVDALEQAKVDRLMNLLAIIEQAAPKQWQAAAWLLEREWPDRYARPEVRLKLKQDEEEIEILPDQP